MPPIPRPRDSGFTTTTPVPLHWCSYGQPGGRRLFVLHGGPGADHQYLLPQMLDLARDHELILYDQRGRGLTPAPPGAHAARVEHDVLDIVAIRNALGIDRWDLAGHSWGSGLALKA